MALPPTFNRVIALVGGVRARVRACGEHVRTFTCGQRRQKLNFAKVVGRENPVEVRRRSAACECCICRHRLSCCSASATSARGYLRRRRSAAERRTIKCHCRCQWLCRNNNKKTTDRRLTTTNARRNLFLKRIACGISRCAFRLRCAAHNRLVSQVGWLGWRGGATLRTVEWRLKAFAMIERRKTPRK